jgi:hypothetical protein
VAMIVARVWVDDSATDVLGGWAGTRGWLRLDQSRHCFAACGQFGGGTAAHGW